MTLLNSGLKSSARIAMVAAVTGILTTSAAMALDCSNATDPGKWPRKFNDGPVVGGVFVDTAYDCDEDNGDAAAECSYLATAQACCPDPSPSASEEECICAVYNASKSIFNAVTIQPPACAAY